MATFTALAKICSTEGRLLSSDNFHVYGLRVVIVLSWVLAVISTLTRIYMFKHLSKL